jgi:hypothetical protein
MLGISGRELLSGKRILSSGVGELGPGIVSCFRAWEGEWCSRGIEDIERGGGSI